MADFSFITGTPSRIEQVPLYNKSQVKSMREQLESARTGLQDVYSGFQPIENRARSQFSQQTIPELLERLTGGFGGSASLSSPAILGQLGQAGSSLEEALAGMRSQYGLQNRQGLLQQLQVGLTPQFQNLPVQGQSGLAEEVLPSLLKFAPLLLGLIPGIGTAAGGAAGVGELLRLMLSGSK